MRTTMVLTLTGPDRVGIVEEITGVLLGLGGNVETSRMVRLGGEFAVLVGVSLPAEKVAQLDAAVAHLTAEGYKVTTSVTDASKASDLEGWAAYRVEVHGADHEGIVHEIAAGLSRQGISIESMETGTSSAPVSGIALFDLDALVRVPPGLSESEWMGALDEAGSHANVDIEIEPQ
ncbi:MAG: transcriptional regulator [Coriobacteriia bacterium]|nr:transcriptional regulator [Coriobacteriia bacterium]